MSLEVFGSTGSSTLDLVNNLKIAIASQVFNSISKFSIDEDKKLSLVNSKTGFELIEPNAIVKYLSAVSHKSNDVFINKDSNIEFEENELYPDIKSGKVSNFTNELNPGYSKVDIKSASQIILFASLYPFLSSSSSSSKDESSTYKWFKEFSENSEISNSIKNVLSNIKLERVKETNTGAIHVKPNSSVTKKSKNIIPKENERNILITSALPYVNNVPHLGNIVGSVLSADIYSRYCKGRDYNTLYICGTDEYGTATETKALEEGISPKELCDKYNKIHSEVYEWFQIGFDYFGRTTTDKQTEIAQEIFMKLYKNNYLESQMMKQLYCPKHNGYLADRFVEGECPKCHYEDARGDQCDKCGNLLDPFELINPRCKIDNETPIPRNSKHIFLSLDKLEPELKKWVEEASEIGQWSKNSRTITQSWLKEGLNPRCITRDLIWGTKVPLEEFKDKVLYVWFDATIGYVSITANYTKSWKDWWYNPNNVNLYQFMGKDNVPFHTVVFPSTQIGTGDNWTKLYHLSTTEYLQYEGGKFSKSRGIGVFGNNAKATGINPSVWRYYLSSIRPETQDSQFSWNEFVTKNNSELLSNLGNFVNRLVKFINSKYNGVIPNFKPENCLNYESTFNDINNLLSIYINDLENVHLRKGLETAMLISSRGNLFLQENKLDNSLYNDYPDKSDAVVGIGINIIYLVSSIISPYMPEICEKILKILNVPSLRIPDKFDLWIEKGHCIGKAEYLFTRIDEKKIDEWRSLYGGKQVS